MGRKMTAMDTSTTAQRGAASFLSARSVHRCHNIVLENLAAITLLLFAQHPFP